MEYTKGEWQTVFFKGMGMNELETYIKISGGVCICKILDRPKIEIEKESNARLIAAAPDLLLACKAQHRAIDILFALLIQKDEKFFPSQSGQPWKAIQQGNKAIKDAETE